MGEVVGLVGGLGLFLVWSACAMPRRPREHAWGSGLASLLSRAGLRRVSVSGLVGLSAGLGLLALLLVWVITATWTVAVAFGLMGAWAPVAVLRSRARSRQDEFAQAWPEAVDNLISAVRAGLSLPEALSALGDSGPESLREPFRQFALDHQVSGRFSDSLDRLKANLADPVGDRVVESLRVAREVGGGDLGRLLRNLSFYLREEARTRSELVARQAWTVNGAKLAVAAPWVVLLLLSAQSDVLNRYASTTGAVVLVVGAVGCAGAYALMMRLGRLPVEKRILA